MNKALSLYLVVFSLLIQPLLVFPQKGRSIDRVSKENYSAQTGESKTSGRAEFGELNCFAARDGVLIRWQMKTETRILGYYIHRIHGNRDDLVNPQVVISSAASLTDVASYGEQYAYLDRFGGASSRYYLEAVDMTGGSLNSTTFKPSIVKHFPIDVSQVANNRDEPRGIESQYVVSTDINLPQDTEMSLRKGVATNLAEFNALASNDGQKFVVSHPGARIDVKSEGIYRVTFAQLQSAGFDTAAPQANWQLYLNGIEQAITINDSAGYIEFYGKGIDTVESDIQGYFLIVGESPGKRIQNLVAQPSTSSVIQASYNQTFQYKQRLFYVNTILNGAPENYWGSPIGGSGLNVKFDLTGIDFNSSTATIEIKLQGFSATTHLVRPILNGQVLNSISGVAQFPMSAIFQIPTSLLKEAIPGQDPQNILNLTALGSGDTVLFDQVNVSFARTQVAAQNTLKAYALNNKKSNLTGFTSPDVRVFDITNENDVRLMTNLPFANQGGTYGAVLPADGTGGSKYRGKFYYAVDDSAIKSPFAVVNNDGETLSSTEIGAQLIIISHKDFLADAQAWADYRTGQGITTKVVNVDEIYNEFGYGVASSDSIKAFLNYASQNWNPTPGYVLLMGDASYDPRNYQGDGYFNYIPPRMVTTVFEETASDEALADFDNDGLAELAIGRIPARKLVNKTFLNADVNSAADSIRIPSHALTTGTKVTFSTTGVLPGDLSTAATYYAIVVDADNVKLAASLENAEAGTPIDISNAAGSGTDTPPTFTLTAYPSTIATALKKVINWEANLIADPLQRGILFTSHWDTATPGSPDDPETLFQEMTKRLINELPAGTPTLHLTSLTSGSADVMGAMNNIDNNVSRGRFFVNYSGHGSLQAWINSSFFAGNGVPQLTNNNNEAVYTMLTCLNGQFHNLRGVSFAELLLNWNNGGAVATWSSTGKTTPDVQEVMARRFYNQLGLGNITRLGDLVKDAKGTLVGGSDVRLSWALIGDPMLKVK